MKLIAIMILLLVGCSDHTNDPTITPPVEEQSQYFTVTLAWDDNNDPQVIGYAIYYRNNITDNYTWATSVNNDQLIIALNFKRDHVNWYFVVTAYSITEESGYSNEVKHII